MAESLENARDPGFYWVRFMDQVQVVEWKWTANPCVSKIHPEPGWWHWAIGEQGDPDPKVLSARLDIRDAPSLAGEGAKIADEKHVAWAGRVSAATLIPVVLETPYAGLDGGRHWEDPDVQRNLLYLRACMRDCVLRGESPYASHGLMTQPGVLSDAVPTERQLGISCASPWREVAAKTIVYQDLGRTDGMKAGVRDAIRVQLYVNKEHALEYRELGEGWDSK